MLNCRIKMGGRNMRAHPVKRCELLFERCQDVGHAIVAGRGVALIFQGLIPSSRK